MERSRQNRTIRVCQNTTCRKQGAASVLVTVEKYAPDEVTVESSGCLGHCGSGPNLLILPDNEWCLHVQPKDVKRLLEQHFEYNPQAISGTQAKANQVFRLWLWGIGGLLVVIAIATWLITKNSYYI